MIVGENSRAILTLTQLVQTPYGGWLYSPTPITPALLRLDPIWDPLRGDPAFQKLCEQKITLNRASPPLCSSFVMTLQGLANVATASDSKSSASYLPVAGYSAPVVPNTLRIWKSLRQ